MTTKKITLDIEQQEYDVEIKYYVVPGSDNSSDHPDDRAEDEPELIVVTGLYILVESPITTTKYDIGYLIEDLEPMLVEKIGAV